MGACKQVKGELDNNEQNCNKPEPAYNGLFECGFHIMNCFKGISVSMKQIYDSQYIYEEHAGKDDVHPYRQARKKLIIILIY